jgi:hypothetical protein
LIPEELQEEYHYPALTKNLKANVFSFNAAKLFGVDVDAKRNALPKDYLSHIKTANWKKPLTQSPYLRVGDHLILEGV